MSFRLVVEIHQDDKPSRRVGFDQSSIRRFVRLGVLVLVAGLLAFGGGLWYLQAGLGNGPSTREENKLLRARIRGLEARQSQVDRALARVTTYDSKIRQLTGQDDGIRAFGIGPLSELEIHQGGSAGSDGRLQPQELEQSVQDGIDGLNEKLDDLDARAVDLETRVNEEERSLIELRAYLDDRTSVLRASPSVWPVRGWVTSHFGWRDSPHGGGRKRHTGLDVAAPVGTPIIAAADGHIVFADYHKAYGNLMVIDHGYGLATKYAHCSKLLAEAGDRVQRGELVARVGNTGRSTGPHLHFEVLENGVSTNPLKYLRSE